MVLASIYIGGALSGFSSSLLGVAYIGFSVTNVSQACLVRGRSYKRLLGDPMKIFWLQIIEGEKGATVPEMTLAAPIMLIALISIFDLTRAGFNKLAIQHSLYTAARYGITGQVHDGSTREESIRQAVVDQARTYGVILEDSMITICPAGETCEENNAGGTGAFVQVVVTKPLEMFFSSVTLNISASVVTKNEPFDE